MPTILLFASMTGNRRIRLLSMMRAALLALSVSRHQITPLVITSLAVSLDTSLPFATPLTVMSRSVTIPISSVVSPTGMAPMSCCRIFFASVPISVSGDTHSTFLCIIFLNYIGDLLSVVGLLLTSHETLPHHRQALIQIDNGSNRMQPSIPEKEGTDSVPRNLGGRTTGGDASDFVANCPSERSTQFPRAAPMRWESSTLHLLGLTVGFAR